MTETNYILMIYLSRVQFSGRRSSKIAWHFRSASQITGVKVATIFPEHEAETKSHVLKVDDRGYLSEMFICVLWQWRFRWPLWRGSHKHYCNYFSAQLASSHLTNVYLIQADTRHYDFVLTPTPFAILFAYLILLTICLEFPLSFRRALVSSLLQCWHSYAGGNGLRALQRMQPSSSQK